MTQRLVRHLAVPMALVGLLCGPAFAAETYQANLGPMPLDEATKKNMLGRGDATAVWDGKALTITGKFAGLTSPAIKAHLIIGPYIGVPGTESLDLTVSPATSGTVTGQLALNGRQATAFRTGKTYVQIDTQNAPTGTLWGWLLPSHEDAAPNVPQQGPWFLPQLNTPSR